MFKYGRYSMFFSFSLSLSLLHGIALCFPHSFLQVSISIALWHVVICPFCVRNMIQTFLARARAFVRMRCRAHIHIIEMPNSRCHITKNVCSYFLGVFLFFGLFHVTRLHWTVVCCRWQFRIKTLDMCFPSFVFMCPKFRFFFLCNHLESSLNLA